MNYSYVLGSSNYLQLAPLSRYEKLSDKNTVFGNSYYESLLKNPDGIINTLELVPNHK